jgi:hypothetical protein
MDELYKIGDIHTVNDIFDFKLSIKTILIILFLWCIGCAIFMVFIFGGVNNTYLYLLNIMETVKTAIKNKRDLKMQKVKEKKETSDDKSNGDKTSDGKNTDDKK